MQKFNLISGLVFSFLGLFFVIEGFQLKFGSFSMPKAGFSPVLLGILMIFLTILLIGTALFDSKRKERDISVHENPLKILSILASMVVYGIFLEKIGYLIMTFLWFSFLLILLEAGWLLRAFLYGALASGTSYIIFRILIQAQLPAGLLGI